jgi:phage major head subunit gpT-like protein
MATFTTSLPDLLVDGFRKVFFDDFNRYEDEYTKLFHIESSSKPNEDDTRIGTLGLFPTRTEGSTVTYDDPPQGFDVTYTHLEYAMGFQVTRIMVEDDQYRVMNRMPSQLGISLRQTIETDGANLLNNGFNSSFTGGDGIELFSTVHVLPGGGTEQNEPTNAADLDATSIEQAMIDIAATVDDRGKKVVLRPVELTVPKENEWNARKLFGSAQDPDSANNTINPAMGLLPINVNHFLTDPDAWFIRCEPFFSYWFWRRNPEFGRDNDFETDNMRFKGTARWSNGFSDWYGWYASPGI